MKQATSSSFNEGLLMDMNPLTTPQTCMSDAVNATLVTFNGNEFTLQSDNGNVQIPGSQIKEGYVPVGMTEYGGIIYVALLNPETNDCEIGSIPSPDFDVSPKGANKDGIEILFKAVGGDTPGYSKFIKFFERDQLVINPGDLYEIVENGTKPKLYKYEYKALDANEKEFDLKTPNIVSQETNEYKPFNQTISATIGLKITLDNISYFDSYAYIQNDRLKLYFFGENKLQEVGEEDDIYIKQVKYKFIDSNGVEGIDNIINIDYSDGFTNKISKLLDLDIPTSLGEVFSIIVTPVSNYEELKYLSKKLEINKEKMMTITPQSTLFKYFYNSTTKLLRFEFDATFLPTESDYMYLEFYDIWSDYSVIYSVEDPNPFGKNLLYIDVSNEELTEDFDTTIGGIPKEEIITSTDQFQPTFGSKKIRNKQLLRPNNLYICAIHVIHNNDFSKPTTYKRAFVLNDYLNDSFNKDSVLDMTTLENKKPEIKVNSSVTELSTIPQRKFGSINNLELKTVKNNKTYYYKLESNKDWSDDYNEQFYIDCYKIEKELGIEGSIESVVGPYGLLTVSNPTTTVILKEESLLTNGEDGAVKEFVKKANGNYTYSLIADRKLSADITCDYKNINTHDASKDKSVWDTMFVNKNDPFSSPAWALGGNNSNKSGLPTVIWSYDGNYYNNSGKSINDDQGKAFATNTYGGKYSGYIIGWDYLISANGDNWEWRYYTGHDLKVGDDYKYHGFGEQDVDSSQLNYALYMDTDQHGLVLVFYKNKSSAIDILQSIYVPTSVSKNSLYLNYYSNINSKDSYETSLYGLIDINISGNIVAKQYYKLNDQFINSDYKTILDYYKIPFTDKYVNIQIGNYRYTKSENLPTLTINAGSDENVLDLIRSGLADMEREDAERLTESTLIQDLIYTKKEIWSKAISQFSWDKTKKLFKIKATNTSIEHSFYHPDGYTQHGSKSDRKGLDFIVNYKLDNIN